MEDQKPEMQGGPGDTAPPEQKPQTPETPPAEKPAFTPVYLGGRKFDSAEDLASYTAQLQQEKEELSRYAPAKPVAPVDPDKELADMIFEDPVAAVKVIREQTKKELRQEISEQDTRKSVLSQFYTENPDLKGLEDMVELTRLRIQPNLNKMPLEQAMKELAKTVRGRLSEIKKQPSGGVELPSGQVVTGGTSNGPGSQGAPVQSKPKGFVEQIKSFQARKRK